MLPDGVSNPGPLTYESGTLTIALRGPGALPRTPIFIMHCGGPEFRLMINLKSCECLVSSK